MSSKPKNPFDVFNRYEFEVYCKEQVAKGGRFHGPTNDEDAIDEHFDNLSAWELVCYLGEFMATEGMLWE